MGLTNWQLFFQAIQTGITDQPLGDNEVLTVVRSVNDTSMIDDPEESAYVTVVLADNPASFWRLNDDEGFIQAVRSDGAAACWRLHGDVLDVTGGGRTGIVWGGVTMGASGPLSNLTSAAMFGS